MSALLDTNVLTRLALPDHPEHALTQVAVAALARTDAPLCVVPQNLYEFWVVATRPSGQNGLGFTLSQARDEIARINYLFKRMSDPPDLYDEWQHLVAHYDVMGKPAHDARLVAAMNLHRIPKLLTFNPRDFSRYPMIQVITPSQLAST